MKQLDRHGLQGTKEFQTQVLSLAKLEHPNLVKLIGYCADGDQRLLVFEYVTGSSLQDHLYGNIFDVVNKQELTSNKTKKNLKKAKHN